jgi:acyl-ACP thioesterase
VQRVTDHDVLGHVNNAIAMAAVEEVLHGLAPRRVEVEYREAISPGDDVTLMCAEDLVWLVVDGRVRVSATFR